ncbi:uncharacterized protein BDR25DRAFT_354427 [Lindgomyces ingoldianus]|uniref:Uncharacterized protein n=1 Tax=Lindgomyces ingoldianus TaxID=673940 RepID=A0ACB6QVX4_9PLEO|nr:uncharacterized protein BDR25DRAFT_354427 [Lindgomyces ingoldianus]KAF2471168.1 hypothetical protein BDR25DRAFT_354427 [Lindgomyces ingoldianus]
MKLIDKFERIKRNGEEVDKNGVENDDFHVLLEHVAWSDPWFRASLKGYIFQRPTLLPVEKFISVIKDTGFTAINTTMSGGASLSSESGGVRSLSTVFASMAIFEMDTGGSDAIAFATFWWEKHMAGAGCVFKISQRLYCLDILPLLTALHLDLGSSTTIFSILGCYKDTSSLHNLVHQITIDIKLLEKTREKKLTPAENRERTSIRTQVTNLQENMRRIKELPLDQRVLTIAIICQSSIQNSHNHLSCGPNYQSTYLSNTPLISFLPLLAPSSHSYSSSALFRPPFPTSFTATLLFIFFLSSNYKYGASSFSLKVSPTGSRDAAHNPLFLDLLCSSTYGILRQFNDGKVEWNLLPRYFYNSVFKFFWVLQWRAFTSFDAFGSSGV